VRTTLELDDRLHELARRRAFEERRSLGEVISDLALRGLESEQAARPRRTLGRYAGLIHVADDFDDTPAELFAELDEPMS
jgi:hypothetical protein